MNFIKTQAYKKIKMLTHKRIRAIQGGTSASKSVSIVMWLIALAQSDTVPTITSIVSESFPHLKRGVIRDFLNIMEAQGYFDVTRWNKSDFTYEFETGSKIEFFSVDQADKMRGARRDRLFINECNNVSFEAFEQLEVRTREFIYLDWNPVAEFWFYQEILGKRDDVDHLILTYLDNEALDPNIRASIETRRMRRGWWQVYGMGQLGEVEGKIYKDWAIVEEVPHNARLERRGLDFGFTNDPTAMIAVYYQDGGYILDEELYAKGMLNKQIADTIGNQEYPQVPVVADSAEPKSIAEIKQYGINITGVAKRRGETKSENFKHWAIGLVQNQRISMTKRSTNLIKEYRNYLWQIDKDGNILNEPEHTFSHTMDAVLYALVSIIERPTFKVPPPTAPARKFYPELGF